MVWKPDFGPGEVINLIAFFAAGVGLILAYRQLRQAATTARAEFVKSLVSDFYGNSSIHEAFYQIDCGLLPVDGIIGDKDQDLASFKEIEKATDSLLAYLDMVGRLVKLRAITEQDARALEYEFVTCYKSPEIQKYLTYLDNLYLHRGQGLKPLLYFREFASGISK
ncbi:MAG TPA: hypothetical protein VF932_00645 [Anaerolineae bacterium]